MDGGYIVTRVNWSGSSLLRTSTFRMITIDQAATICTNIDTNRQKASYSVWFLALLGHGYARIRVAQYRVVRHLPWPWTWSRGKKSSPLETHNNSETPRWRWSTPKHTQPAERHSDCDFVGLPNSLPGPPLPLPFPGTKKHERLRTYW